MNEETNNTDTSILDMDDDDLFRDFDDREAEDPQGPVADDDISNQETDGEEPDTSGEEMDNPETGNVAEPEPTGEPADGDQGEAAEDPEKKPDDASEDWTPPSKDEWEKLQTRIDEQKEFIKRRDEEVVELRKTNRELLQDVELTPEQEEEIENIIDVEGYAAARRKEREYLLQNREAKANSEIEARQGREQKVKEWCPSWKDYKSEVVQILKENGIDDATAFEAVNDPASSDPVLISQLYSQAIERRKFNELNERLAIVEGRKKKSQEKNLDNLDRHSRQGMKVTGQGATNPKPRQVPKNIPVQYLSDDDLVF